ncbi:hypothetical protein IMZ48_01570 [Candidatus Bathyarchaeota archaeon]|nr:hypothetical protein [Candidatus Bathyarchaeota archaeon]
MKQYTDNHALDAIARGLNIKRAASDYSVPRSTLQDFKECGE